MAVCGSTPRADPTSHVQRHGVRHNVLPRFRPDRKLACHRLKHEKMAANVTPPQSSLDVSRFSFYQAEIAQDVVPTPCVVHGLVGSALGVEPQTAMLAFAYTLVSNQTAASLKLMRIGQTQAQAVLHELERQLPQSLKRALNRTLDDFGSFTPGVDIRAMQHEDLFRRLFIS